MEVIMLVKRMVVQVEKVVHLVKVLTLVVVELVNKLELQDQVVEMEQL